MYKYETHLHTSPVSKCADASPREALEFYKKLGYDGVFITNHFIDGYFDCQKETPTREQIAENFSDYDTAKELSAEIGIKVFLGLEMTHGGTDFLIYGLEKQWFLDHPEIAGMKKSLALPILMEAGALVIQAHPFREARYIDHIRLYPRCVQGVEIINANRTDFENAMAMHYAESYGLLTTAGSDNHRAERQPKLAGMCSSTPIADEKDFINRIRNREMEIFTQDNPLIKSE